MDTQAILISDLSGVEAVRILFAGAAMDTQTMISDFVWSRGSPHTLCRCRGGHPDRDFWLYPQIQIEVF